MVGGHLVVGVSGGEQARNGLRLPQTWLPDVAGLVGTFMMKLSDTDKWLGTATGKRSLRLTRILTPAWHAPTRPAQLGGLVPN